MMLCEHCKLRNATVSVTQVHNGHKTEVHYCDICAAQIHPFQFNFQQEPLTIQNLISNWFGKKPPSEQMHVHKQPQTAVHCPRCSLSLQQFLKHGKFGCSNCYEAFAEQLPAMLARFQAGTKHVGRLPHQNNEALHLQQQIVQERHKLQQAIQDERFEDAVIIRDNIQSLEQQIAQLGGDSI